MKRCIPVLSVLSVSALILSCGNPKTPAPTDTPISGAMKMVCDKAYEDIVSSMVSTFEHHYEDAVIDVKYASETDVSQSLMRDSGIQVAIMSRDLNEAEKAALAKKRFEHTSVKIAYDGLAILLNRDNADTSLSVDLLKRMLSKTDTSWKQVNPSSTLGRIAFVFDNSGSADARYVSETLMGGKQPGENCFAAANSDSVFAYVSRNKGAVGIISSSLVSDLDDPVVQARLSKVRVARMKALRVLEGNPDFVPPAQSYIADSTYPLVRTVYLIKIGGRAGLGTGFASHAYSDVGQLIVLKSGLLPAKMPERTIIIKQE